MIGKNRNLRSTMLKHIKNSSRLLLLTVIILLLGFFTYIYFYRMDSNVSSLYSDRVISALVLPHYNLDQDQRIELIQNTSRYISPKQIILISVNHLGEGTKNVITTDKIWNFSEQKSYLVNKSLLDNLINDGIAGNELGPFTEEHGIYNVLPNLTRAWPNAEYLPIIIKNTTPKTEIDELFVALKANCTDCLLVSSIDFSHYNPNSLAQIHDATSISALSELDADKAWGAETDSPQTIYLTIKWVESQSTNNFKLFFHSNSGEKNKDNQSETTSYIMGYYSNEITDKTPMAKTTTFLFGGDLMFDRNVYHKFKDTGSIHAFDKLGNRVFWGNDISIANLEGPISDKPINDDYTSGSMVFNFPSDSIEALKYLGLNSVSLANNHSLNAGNSGLKFTQEILQKNSITTIGEQIKFSENSVHDFNSGVPTSIITVNMLENPDLTPIDDAIKSLKVRNNFVIVFPHWGAEYQTTHGSSQETIAKRWIDAGADMVIGSHPHVVQDCQIYKGKFVAYSMGNFLFDQYFSTETQRGLFIGGMITKDKTTISLFPIKNDGSQPQLLKGSERQTYLDRCIASINDTLFNKVRDDTIEIKN